MMGRLGLVAAFACIAVSSLCGQDASSPAQVTRAVASLNGVFSPRGFFNLTVRLYQLPGVDWAKYDLKKSRITLDFKPGVTVTPKDIEQVMVSAGYRPGPVHIEVLAASQVSQTGPGWVKIKHPTSKHAVIRWFQLNF